MVEPLWIVGAPPTAHLTPLLDEGWSERVRKMVYFRFFCESVLPAMAQEMSALAQPTASISNEKNAGYWLFWWARRHFVPPKFCPNFFIRPESDHWLCLSVTPSLTHSLTDSLLFSKLDGLV